MARVAPSVRAICGRPALGRLLPLSVRIVSGVVVLGPVRVVHYGRELSSSGEPVASKGASDRGVGVALHWLSVRSGHVRSSSSLLVYNDVELWGFTFAHAPPDVVWVGPSDRCRLDEDDVSGVVAINEGVPFVDVKRFYGNHHSPICHFC